MGEDEALTILRGDDPERAARAEAALWAMWSRSGIPEVDALLRAGIDAMERRDAGEADACFARIIGQAPGFAEGWNKRATLRYVTGDYEGSVADCRETLVKGNGH